MSNLVKQSPKFTSFRLPFYFAFGLNSHLETVIKQLNLHPQSIKTQNENLLLAFKSDCLEVVESKLIDTIAFHVYACLLRSLDSTSDQIAFDAWSQQWESHVTSTMVSKDCKLSHSLVRHFLREIEWQCTLLALSNFDYVQKCCPVTNVAMKLISSRNLQSLLDLLPHSPAGFGLITHEELEFLDDKKIGSRDQVNSKGCCISLVQSTNMDTKSTNWHVSATVTSSEGLQKFEPCTLVVIDEPLEKVRIEFHESLPSNLSVEENSQISRILLPAYLEASLTEGLTEPKYDSEELQYPKFMIVSLTYPISTLTSIQSFRPEDYLSISIIDPEEEIELFHKIFLKKDQENVTVNCCIIGEAAIEVWPKSDEEIIEPVIERLKKLLGTNRPNSSEISRVEPAKYSDSSIPCIMTTDGTEMRKKPAHSWFETLAKQTGICITNGIKLSDSLIEESALLCTSPLQAFYHNLATKTSKILRLIDDKRMATFSGKASQTPSDYCTCLLIPFQNNSQEDTCKTCAALKATESDSESEDEDQQPDDQTTESGSTSTSKSLGKRRRKRRF
ncbi:hypothetical protein Ciccas_003021 [Cichlidogyrus casuarinus]|uniref:Uncharacterized protein n=1 Tax=Cichlidogyrus casuarinus TaxID=1844966 RepID=A0ABD2QFN4_9PLAT